MSENGNLNSLETSMLISNSRDISKPIPFCAIGKHCQELHCYNGHVWISLGAIPELKAPTYAEMRNRVCMDGSEWLKPEMKAFMSTKLYNMNAEYTISEKIYADIENRLAEFNHFRERVVRKAKKMVLLKRNYCEDDKIKCTKTILPPLYTRRIKEIVFSNYSIFIGAA